ncbi:AzlC family ABC transporter permease [Williamsia sp.]|uniref:AzlC family ABC transporter permease n=1 Tax=Williamsia sp. TaxID=1872085 RepID=UPI001A1DBE48|nr:AzlC family ABC transporter permease [Williamsia sp.]MBJ7291223.1 AzlC family ABC transporter permease [Williamsia sp.]
MRSLSRSSTAVDPKPILAVALSVGMVGISYGATATSAGFTWWQVVLIAAAVFGASSEFLFVGVLAAGAGPVAAVMAGLLVNLRNIAYGMSASAYLSPGVQSLVGAHFVNDETVALAADHGAPADRRRVFWWAGSAMFVAWPAGAAIGAVLGTVAGDPRTWGLDAVFPTLILALLIPMMKERATAAVVGVAAVIAVVVTPFVPAGVGPVLALLALCVLPVVRSASTATDR